MQDSVHVDHEAFKQILSSIKEEQTDTPEQEMLPKVTEQSSASNAPVWSTFPLPTITNVFSMGTPQTTVDVDKKPEKGSDLDTVVKALDNGLVPKKIGFHKRMKVEEIIRLLRKKIWKFHPPILKFKPIWASVRDCKSVLLNQIPVTILDPLHIKQLIFLRTDFDPFTKQTMHVTVFEPHAHFQRAKAMLLFSNNEDCMKVYFGLRGLVLSKKKITVRLDWGGVFAKANNCIYPSQNETRGQIPPLFDNSFTEDIHSDTSEVQNNNSNNKDSTDKLATNETVETVPIKQEPADEVDISVTDFEMGEAITEELSYTDFVAMMEKKEMDTSDMNETTNEAEGDTECTVVHVKRLPVHKEYDSVITLLKSCNCFDVYEKIFYIRQFKAGGVFANVNGDCLLKFTTHSDAVQVCDYFNKLSFKAKLDIGNAISESEELIPIYLDDKKKQPILAKFTDRWQKVDFTHKDKIVNDYENYGLGTDILKAVGIPRHLELKNGILITNLSAKVTEAKLIEVFSMAGNIKQTYMRAVCMEGIKMARIEYDHPVEAVQAISMFHHRKLYGKSMYVRMNPFEMVMPVGLDDIGKGLGIYGTPLKDVRASFLEKTMSRKLSEMKKFESRNGPSFADNERTSSKTANTDVTAILGTVIESLRNAAAAQGLLQSETNSKVFTDVISALQKHQQSGLLNKPDAASSCQIIREPMVDTGSIFSTDSSKSNPANISLSNQLTSKQNTRPLKSPQPSQSKYKTESNEKEKKQEISRKRDYEGKITNAISGDTDADDAKKLKPVLYFRNLPESVSTEVLTKKMQEVGDLMFGQVTGKGRAIVCFKTVEDSERCLQLFHHSRVDGQVIEVKVKQKLRPVLVAKELSPQNLSTVSPI